jgi:(p)ppGpp synthase/HD superfamily hydrolase
MTDLWTHTPKAWLADLRALPIQERAEKFATMAHSDQSRDDGTLYIEHPRRVVESIKQVGLTDDNSVATAWMHDVDEDTDWTIEHIADLFNDQIANMVMSLTLHLPRYPRDFPHHLRSELKMLALKGKTFEMRTEAKVIKVADRIDNLRGAWHSWRSERIERYAKQAEGLFMAIEKTTDALDPVKPNLDAILEEAWPIANALSQGEDLAEAN